MSRLTVKKTSQANPSLLRSKIAREAANLLYLGVEKEYKQAKLKAIATLRGSFLPSNREIAFELDRIAEENEGQARQERLTRMRKDALVLMENLKEYHPILVGSVWRGTINRNSDIDIVAYHNEQDHVLTKIENSGFKILNSEWVRTTEQGRKKESLHIYVELPTNEKAEIIVRSCEEAEKAEKCDIYGDQITGLHTEELKGILMENPTQQFLP
jgi:predicted nucleotidyltransferase